MLFRGGGSGDLFRTEILSKSCSEAKSHQNMEFLERLNEPEFDSLLVKSKIIDFNTNNYSKLI